MNEYVVYPGGTNHYSLADARKKAKAVSKREGSAYIKNRFTNKTVGEYSGGKKNPARARRKNPPRRRNAGTSTKMLRNFTGVVRFHPKEERVDIIGVDKGEKVNPSRKKAKRKNPKRRARR